MFGSNTFAPASGATNTEVVVALPPATDERPEPRFKCLLSAVASMESGYQLLLASGVPLQNSRLALSDRFAAPASATTAIHRKGDSFVAHSVKIGDTFRFGWIVAHGQVDVSRPTGGFAPG